MSMSDEFIYHYLTSVFFPSVYLFTLSFPLEYKLHKSRDFCLSYLCSGGSVVKNPPAVQEMQETQVHSLGREDPLE